MTKTKAKTKQQSLTNKLANYIERNPTFFTDGTTFTLGRFRQRFGKFFSLPQKLTLGTHLSYVQAQVSLNKLLNLRGLRIKSSNNYSTWRVTYDTSYPAKQLKTAKDITNASNRLDAGIRTYRGVVSKFSDFERSTTQQHIRSNRVN